MSDETIRACPDCEHRWTPPPGHCPRCSSLAQATSFGVCGGYEIVHSNGRGGKAGTGHNSTSTVQVREPMRPGEYLLLAQFRYTVGNSKSESNAHMKARAWIDAKRLNSELSSGGPAGQRQQTEQAARRLLE